MPSGIYKRINGINAGLVKGKHWKLSNTTKAKMSAKRKGYYPKHFEMFKHFNLGRKASEETRKRMSESKKGKPSNAKGKHWEIENPTCYWLGKKRPPMTEEQKKKISLAKLGKKISEKTPTKMIGKLHKDNCMCPFCKTKRGEYAGRNSPNWKGGITPINRLIRSSSKYKDWRLAVFERDNYTCQACGSRGIALHADHIKPFAYYPELRLVIENGRTLCIPCHKKTDTYKKKNKLSINKII